MRRRIKKIMPSKKKQNKLPFWILLAAMLLFVIGSALWFAYGDTRFTSTLILGVEDTESPVRATRGGMAVTDNAVGNTISVLRQDDRGSYRSIVRPSTRFYYYTHREYPSFLNRFEMSVEMDPSAYPVQMRIPCDDCGQTVTPLLAHIPGVENMQAAKLNSGLWAYDALNWHDKEVGSMKDVVTQLSIHNRPLYIAEDALDSIQWSDIVITENPNRGTYTEVPTTVLAGQELFVYIDSELDIRFTKRNRNKNVGSDALIVRALTVDGDLVSQVGIEDDGIVNGKGGSTEDAHSIVLRVDQPGVYVVQFSARQNTDFGLLDMELSSGAVAFEKGVFLKNAELFTKDDVDGYVRVAHKGSIRGTIQSVDENGSVLETTGENPFDTQERLAVADGGMYIESTEKFSVADGIFSFSEDSWFNPYQVPIAQTWTNVEGVATVTRAHIYESNGAIRADSHWAESDLAPIYELDVARKKRLRIDAEVVLHDWSDEEQYIYQYYNQYARVCGINVMTKFDIEEVIAIDTSCADPVRRAYNAIPADYELYAGTYSLASVQSADIDTIDVDTSTVDHEFNVRGNSTYALLLDGSADITVSKYDMNRAVGDDTVRVRLVDSEGQEIKSTAIADDGDTLNSARTQESQTGRIVARGVSGLYFLEVVSEQEDSIIDFVVESIRVNSSKVQAIDAKRIVGPSVAYMLIDRSTKLDITVRDRSQESNLHVIDMNNNGSEIASSAVINGESLRFELNPGLYKLELPDSRTVLSEPVLTARSDAHFAVSGMVTGTEMVFMEHRVFPEVALRSIESDLQYGFSLQRYGAFTAKGIAVFLVILIKLYWEQYWKRIQKRLNPGRISAIRGFLAGTSIVLLLLWFDAASELLGIVDLTTGQYWIVVSAAIASIVLLALISNIFFKENGSRKKR